MAFERIVFGAADYALFALVLVVSASVGLYYAIFAGRQRTTSEFLMADRSMGFVPVALSLIASLFTGIFIQGVSADVYYRAGTMAWWHIVGQVGASWIAARCFLPIYFNLRLTSIYEYLELRFNPAVRTCGLVICYAYMLLHSGIATFGASMVIIAVTKMSLAGSILLLSFVTMFYTTIGGIKAVLWADSFQMILIFTSLVAVIIKGSMNVGGIAAAFAIADEGHRVMFWNTSLDPKEYLTVWNSLTGIIAWLPAQAIMQYQVQRYLTCKDLKTANWAISVYASGMVLMTTLLCLAGVVMYASYAGCDPYVAGHLRFRDGLLPYFILDSFHHLPGLSGLLTAGLCSLCLSTVSSVLNALSAVTGQHIVSVYWPNLSERIMVIISKALVVCFGVVVIAASFLMTRLGDLIPALLGIIGITNGPILGVFMLGIFTTKANSKGVLAGFFTSLAFGLWLLIGSLRHPYPPKPLPLSIDECRTDEMTTEEIVTMTTMATTMMGATMANNMTTMAMTVTQTRSTLLNFYALSKLWYPVLTTAISIVVGYVVSLITGWYPVLSTAISILVGYVVSLITGANEREKLDPRLIVYMPDACCFFLPNKWKFWKRDHELQEIPPTKELPDTDVPLTADYEDHNSTKIPNNNSKVNNDIKPTKYDNTEV